MIPQILDWKGRGKRKNGAVSWRRANAFLARDAGCDVGLSQDGDDLVGALDCGIDNNDTRERSRTGNFRGGATRACRVSDKMRRWRHEM